MWETLEPKPLILESLVAFEREISVVVARGLDGRAVAFDPVENRHRDGILDLTLAPAPIPPDVAVQATRIALDVAEALGLVGLLAVEMFVQCGRQRDGERDRAAAAQFRALDDRRLPGQPVRDAYPGRGRPAAAAAVRHSDAVMKNLVGPDEVAQWPAILASPGLVPHLYGKAEARPGRKMGHVNRLFPKGGLPGAFGIEAALGPLARRQVEQDIDTGPDALPAGRIRT